MRILVASQLEQSALRQLQQRHDVICTFDQPTADLCSLVHDREVFVFRSGVEITRALMDCAPDLRLLVRAGCGLDNLDCEYVRKRGIVLRRISEPAAQAVAEMALALMFALARNIRQADTMLRRGQWAKDTLEGHLLAGKVLGIVGWSRSVVLPTRLQPLFKPSATRASQSQTFIRSSPPPISLAFTFL